MADTVTTQTLIDGPRNVVVKLSGISDGTGEAAVLKVDVSALNGAPNAVRIDRIDYNIQGESITLLWDATTDVTIIVLNNGADSLDFRDVGGLTNNAGAGKTGDILLTTTGHSSGDTYSIVLHMVKKS